MFKQFLNLRRAFIRSVHTHVLLGAVTLTTLAMLTILAAIMLMLLTWHWPAWLIFVVSIAPWVAATIIITIISCIQRRRIKKSRKALFSALPLEIFSLVLAFLSKK